ncbi:MAG: mucoidy inhibitor MuiA family protein [Planctomycetota bacterium]
MKTPSYLALALAFSPFLKADAFDFPSKDSPIRQVRLYDRGARVERPLVMNLATGRHTIHVSDLTGSLSPDSLQLTGLPSHVTVLEVTPRLRLVKSNPSPLVAQLEAEILGHERAIQDLRDHMTSLSREDSRLDTYQEMARQAVSEQTVRAPLDPKALQASLEFFTTRRLEIATQLRADEKSLRDLQEKAHLARRNLGELRPLQQTVTDVDLLVEATSPFQGAASLAYVVDNASWTPVYEAQHRGNNLHLGIGAQVSQNSGEDWKDVSLTFSTSRPSLGAQAPQLSPIGLSFMNVNPDRKVDVGGFAGRRSLDINAQGLSVGADPLPPGSPSFEKTGINVVLIAEGRSSVSSGAGTSRVNVRGHDLDGTVEWVTIPSHNARVFRRLTGPNKVGHPLLAGSAQLFSEGRFLGFSQLAHRSPGEPLNLSLGQDALIKVRRQIDNDRCQAFKEATFGTSKTGRVSYLIELKNEGTEARTIQVMEAIPVPELEGIKVKLTDSCTPPTVHGKDGILTWKVELKPGESREVRLEYEIEVPGNMQMDLPIQ